MTWYIYNDFYMNVSYFHIGMPKTKRKRPATDIACMLISSISCDTYMRASLEHFARAISLKKVDKRINYVESEIKLSQSYNIMKSTTPLLVRGTSMTVKVQIGWLILPKVIWMSKSKFAEHLSNALSETVQFYLSSQGGVILPWQCDI